MKKVGIIGSGIVAKTLAKGFIALGHPVMLGTRQPEKLQAEISGEGILAGRFAQAAQFGELLVLAVKGTAASEALRLAGTENLVHKAVIDTTNPIADQPPVNGVLSYFTGPNDSLCEQLQRQVPDAHFVKAFNSVGNARMVNPDFGGTQPTMFICGNHPEAKVEVSTVLTQFGWEVVDLGQVEAARAIESLAVLWCIPGFLNHQWTHAFKLLK